MLKPKIVKLILEEMGINASDAFLIEGEHRPYRITKTGDIQHFVGIWTDSCYSYKDLIDIIDASRNPKNYALEELVDIIHFGASPRATIDMFKAVKASAFLRGNDFVSPIDIALVAKNVLRHRIILTYEAMAKEINVDDVIQKILEKIAIP